MSAKDSEKFCGNTSEKPEEKNKKNIVYKNNKIYKPIRDFIDLDRFLEDVNIYKKSTAFCCAFFVAGRRIELRTS